MSAKNIIDIVEQTWRERGHYEALRINRQLEIAPSGVTLQHIIDFNRFCECVEDDEGYDVPKERMRDLKAVGLVEGGRFGWYKSTNSGIRLRNVWFDMRPCDGVANTDKQT